MRVWTVDEANEALDWVGACVERIRTAVTRAREARSGVGTPPSGNGHGPSGNGQGGPGSAQAALDRLNAEGIVVRDPEMGLVDFPALAPGGRPYWLCWVAGEPEVAWWHWQTEGFAGRKPLTTPPE